MLFSIIINTHNQHETINRCLRSCLNQNFKKKYEIIVIDTSDKKIDKEKIKSSKIKYYHFKNFSKYPEINQLKKVYKGFKKAKGKWFCLMDGDDYFKKNKLSSIYKKYNLKKNFLLQDNYIYFNEYNKIKDIHVKKKYKQLYIYKKLINFWPEVHGTSSLSGNMKILNSFFKIVSLNKWKFLAIDALLVLYSLNNNNFYFNNEVLTIKSIGHNNLGDKYKVINKNYWIRRNQQITYWETLSGKKIYNLDKVLSKIINFFQKNINIFFK